MSIEHTVVFRLRHEDGSGEEERFLADAERALRPIAGVERFAIRRQISGKTDLRWQFSMRFADRAAYDAYDADPAHVEFVRSRWQQEVAAFQEYDFDLSVATGTVATARPAGEDRAALIGRLEDEAERLVLPRFDAADAWRLGGSIVEAALRHGHGIAVDVRRAGFVLFHAALPGSAPDQDHWIRRKSAVALRLEASTLLLRERFAAAGVDPTAGWLPAADYAVAGGSVPIRVAGVGVVAVATVSGLTDEEDHALVVDAIEALRTDMLPRVVDR